MGRRTRAGGTRPWRPAPSSRGTAGEILHVGEEVGGATLLARPAGWAAAGREPVEAAALPLRLRVRPPPRARSGTRRVAAPLLRDRLERRVGKQRRRRQGVLAMGGRAGHPQPGAGLLLPPGVHHPGGTAQRPLLPSRARGEQDSLQRLARALVGGRGGEGARTAQDLAHGLERRPRVRALGLRRAPRPRSSRSRATATACSARRARSCSARNEAAISAAACSAAPPPPSWTSNIVGARDARR